MKPVIVEYPLGDDAPQSKLYYGIDVREALRLLPDQSVQMVATSPPYWGLRSYNVEGQLGLEETPQEYVENLVSVFREVRRVLRDDGVVWLNLGDSYVSTPTGNMGTKCGLDGVKSGSTRYAETVKTQYTKTQRPPVPAGMKMKDLVGIPWMVAFALRADGWYLRSDVIWAKNAVMPESVRDRPTKSHEYVFLLTKNERYFYDQDAIKEPHKFNRWSDRKIEDAAVLDSQYEGQAGKTSLLRGGATGFHPPGGRNKRTVWTVNPKPYKGSHFATWPEKLVEPMILAGSSEEGCCSSCGAPRVRVIEKKRIKGHNPVVTDDRKELHGPTYSRHKSAIPGGQSMVGYDARTVGWKPSCKCDAHTIPCTVLDPFSGSATTGLVAMKQGRNYIGIDINAEYLALATARLQERAAPEKVKEEDDEPNVLEFLT